MRPLPCPAPQCASECSTLQNPLYRLGMQSVAWLAVLRQLKVLYLEYENEHLLRTCAVFPPGDLPAHRLTSLPAYCDA